METPAKLFTVMVFTALCVSFVPLVYAQAIGRQVSPFDFQLDESAVDGKLYSYLTGPGPAAIIKQNETKSLPVIILSATGKPILVKFHVTVGSNQTGPVQMPLGVNATVEPSEIMLGYKQNYTVHITVSADKNAPDGKYALNIVGEWPQENGFVGSSIVINIGKDFGPNSMPFNFQWTPLKQFQSGVPARNVSCAEGFQLILKSEDGSPACVKLTSIQKLVLLQWALKPINELTVEEFKDTYKIGEKIDFAIKFKGFRSCGPPSFLIKNAENKTMWESPIVLTLCDPDTGYGEYKWKFRGLYTLILNQTGSYSMNISFSNKTLEKEFEIK